MASPLSLHVNFRNQGIRWPLHDNYDVQVWSAESQLVATLSGRIIRHLVELHLASAVLQSEVVALIRKPLAPLPQRTLRETRRLQRRSRKKVMRIPMKTILRLAAPLALLLVGCATPSTWLVNADGQSVLCAATGWGAVGAPVAAVSHDQCVRNFRRVGYVDLPDVLLGIRFDAADPPKITSIDPASPAAAVGIQRGDVLQSVAGQPVKNYRDLASILREHKAGDPIVVIVVRDSVTTEFTPTLAQR